MTGFLHEWPFVLMFIYDDIQSLLLFSCLFSAMIPEVNKIPPKTKKKEVFFVIKTHSLLHLTLKHLLRVINLPKEKQIP